MARKTKAQAEAEAEVPADDEAEVPANDEAPTRRDLGVKTRHGKYTFHVKG